MRLAILGGGALFAAFLAGNAIWGFWAVYQIAYGAFVLMAAMIAATFFWLWRRRATPLALGMVMSWAGGAFVMGWWWLFQILGHPTGMTEHPALFAGLALYLTGTAMHFSVIGANLGWPRVGWAIPVVLAASVSLALTAVI
jgi:hypothetical protein